VIRSEPPTLLEESQSGRTFSRRVRYLLEPAGERTRLTVEDDISFLGLARLASPVAAATCRRAGSARSSGCGTPRSGGRRPPQRDFRGRLGNHVEMRSSQARVQRPRPIPTGKAEVPGVPPVEPAVPPWEPPEEEPEPETSEPPVHEPDEEPIPA